MSNDTELINEITKLRKSGKTWDAIGLECGVSGALIWKIAKGMCSSNKVRACFGLPLKTVEADPCSKCGGIHTQKTCAHSRPKQSRFRVALEFETKTEQREMITILAEYGANRIEQSSNLKQRIKQ